MNWPTRLTVARLFLVPALIATLMFQVHQARVIASAVLALAGVTDILDGYLARRRGEESTLGRLLDPLADKMIVIAGVTMLAVSHRLGWGLAAVLIAKEALQVGGASYFWLQRRRMLPASFLGKAATVLLYAGMFGAIWGLGGAKYLVGLGIATSVVAGFNYTQRVLFQA